jgi:alpha-ribazole phosphatase
MRVLLIRHSITIYNLEHRYQGWVDIPLCAAGKVALQPKQVWEQNPKEVYVSPLIRARQTAEILFPEATQHVVEEFREFNFGEFDGYTYEELASHPDYQPWVDGMCMGPCPGGEDRKTYQKRTVKGFLELMQKTSSDVVIVAHGGTQMALLSQFCPECEDYYEAQLPAGWGYDLEWDGTSLHIIGRIDFTKGA